MGLLKSWLGWFRRLFQPKELSAAARSGLRGENLAAKHLKKQGFRIVARNWRWKRWEIDIIATKGSLVLFVEVKARSRTDFGRPEEAVDRNKAVFVHRAATAFIKQHRLQQAVQRFDIVAVTYKEGGHPEISHIENAF